MTEYIHLVGTEQVQSAANSMRSSAETMKMAANQIDSSLDMFIRRFEELVTRLELVARLERVNEAPTLVQRRQDDG